MVFKEVAEAFSNGSFKVAYPHFSDNVRWRVIGENSFNGKKAVIENCEKVAGYFESVTTNFTTETVIAAGRRVAVIGTAEFVRDGKRVNFVSACDVYEFNESNQLVTISSYCIADKR